MLTLLTSLLVEQVTKEHQRANSLLLNVFPKPIVNRLKSSTDIIADRFERCAVLFADIAGFTRHSHETNPEIVVAELNEIFSRFDGLAEEFGVEKIKTIGDGYMAVAGAPVESEDCVASICSLALAMRDEIKEANRDLGTDFDVRIGLHTGEAVAGVIGQSRFSYDMWGDTVNIASRMESQGEPGLIQATAAIRANAPSHFRFEPAGVVPVRGIGEMEVFHLTGHGPASSFDD
jgi:adenylate cyclase